MIIAIIYIFFVLCNILWTVESYFQKIFSLPLPFLSPSPLFTHSPCPPPPHLSPLKIQKYKASFPFLPTLKIFQVIPAEIGEETV